MVWSSPASAWARWASLPSTSRRRAPLMTMALPPLSVPSPSAPTISTPRGSTRTRTPTVTCTTTRRLSVAPLPSTAATSSSSPPSLASTTAAPRWACRPWRHIHRQLEESLARLGTSYVDLYYQHRQDPSVPIEQVATTLEKLRQAGKIKYIGFSEITADELRRAAAICPVSAIQMEYSLQTREIENDIIPTARELGVGIVAYSPLGRGLLSRTFTAPSEIAEGDGRGRFPRLNGDGAQANYDAAARLEAIAVRLGLAPATLALAWLIAKGDDIFPIPGSKRPERVEQNLAAATVKLTPEVIAELEAAVPPAVGGRYPAMTVGSTWENRAKPL
eukprot:m.80139 g.80139  ORF g.80139 m.80139 type:complete len:333 (+) comp8025_c0_seq2:122-1120(+)